MKKSKTGPKPKAKDKLLVPVTGKITADEHREMMAYVDGPTQNPEIGPLTKSSFVRLAIRLALGLSLIACGSPVGETAQVASEPQWGATDGDVRIVRKTTAVASRFNSGHLATPGQPPPMRATEATAPGSSPRAGRETVAPTEPESVLFIASADINLREALRVPVAALRADGYPLELRTRCVYGTECTEAFWEGMPGPVRARVACPADEPERRELSVDASLDGDELRTTLGAMLRIAVGDEPGCVETEEAYRP